VAERVMRLVGHPEVISEPWFETGRGRAQHADQLDAMVGTWIGDRDLDEVVSQFEKASAAVAPVYDIADIFEDPQYRALDSITTIDDEDLGPIRMQNLMFRLTATPGAIKWSGRGIGADNKAIYGELGIDAAELAELSDLGAI
jgi:crotonobetainyl-CoA:carnitine CoA-transferase CaiB-like acyl-CoA transferase